jgi:Bacterial type II and III secretion system protein
MRTRGSSWKHFGLIALSVASMLAAWGAAGADDAARTLPPKAGQEGAAAIPARKVFSFEMRNKPWMTVLEWLADQTQMPVMAAHAPPGTFTFVPPRAGNQYTLPQIIDILNDSLNPQKELLIRRRDNSFTLVAADEKLDPALVRQVRLQELDQYGKSEPVAVVLTLTSLSAPDAAAEIRKLTGPFGQVVALKQSNQLLVQDTAGNVKRIGQTLADMDIAARSTKTLKSHEVPAGFANPLARLLQEAYRSSGSTRIAPVSDRAILVYADPETQGAIAQQLESLRGSSASPPAQPPQPPPPPATRRGRSSRSSAGPEPPRPVEVHPARTVHVEIFFIELSGKAGGEAGADSQHLERVEWAGPAHEVITKIRDLQKEGFVAGVRRIQVTTLDRQPARIKDNESTPYTTGVTVTPGFGGGGAFAGGGRGAAGAGAPAGGRGGAGGGFAGGGRGALGGPNTSRLISYRNVGTSVQVTPEMGADGLVSLDLRVEHSRVRPAEGVSIGSDDKGTTIPATAFVTCTLESRVKVRPGYVVLAQGTTASSKSGQAQAVILVSARTDETGK